MKYRYRTEGICTPEIEIEIDENNNTIKEAKFIGPGCPGNRIGISNLVRGKPVKEIIDQLDGIRCGTRKSSCPGQLAEALKVYWNKINLA